MPGFDTGARLLLPRDARAEEVMSGWLVARWTSGRDPPQAGVRFTKRCAGQAAGVEHIVWVAICGAGAAALQSTELTSACRLS
jgi:hypothetical protein